MDEQRTLESFGYKQELHRSVATVDLVRAGVGIGTCVNGLHVAESDGPFGVVVWGTDAYASYAYPAGGNARQLVMLPPLI